MLLLLAAARMRIYVLCRDPMHSLMYLFRWCVCVLRRLATSRVVGSRVVAVEHVRVVHSHVHSCVHARGNLPLTNPLDTIMLLSHVLAVARMKIYVLCRDPMHSLMCLFLARVLNPTQHYLLLSLMSHVICSLRLTSLMLSHCLLLMMSIGTVPRPTPTSAERVHDNKPSRKCEGRGKSRSFRHTARRPAGRARDRPTASRQYVGKPTALARGL